MVDFWIEGLARSRWFGEPEGTKRNQKEPTLKCCSFRHWLPSRQRLAPAMGAEFDKFLNGFLIFHVCLSVEIICDYF